MTESIYDGFGIFGFLFSSKDALSLVIYTNLRYILSITASKNNVLELPHASGRTGSRFHALDLELSKDCVDRQKGKE